MTTTLEYPMILVWRKSRNSSWRCELCEHGLPSYFEFPDWCEYVEMTGPDDVPEDFDYSGPFPAGAILTESCPEWETAWDCEDAMMLWAITDDGGEYHCLSDRDAVDAFLRDYPYHPDRKGINELADELWPVNKATSNAQQEATT